MGSKIGRIYTKEFKEEVIRQIKEEGKSVTEISRLHGMNANVIYRWIGKGIGRKDNTILEINRLRRENAELLMIIGELTREVKKGKKI